jgi:hypothetical protein
MHVLAALGDAPTATIAVLAILLGLFVVARGRRGEPAESQPATSSLLAGAAAGPGPVQAQEAAPEAAADEQQPQTLVSGDVGLGEIHLRDTGAQATEAAPEAEAEPAFEPAPPPAPEPLPEPAQALEPELAPAPEPAAPEPEPEPPTRWRPPVELEPRVPEPWAPLPLPQPPAEQQPPPPDQPPPPEPPPAPEPPPVPDPPPASPRAIFKHGRIRLRKPPAE